MSSMSVTFKPRGDAAIGHVRIDKKPFARTDAVTD